MTFLITIIITSLIVAGLLRKVHRPLGWGETIVLAFGFAPILAALILYFLLLFWPNHPNGFYASGVSIVFFIILLISQNEFMELLKESYSLPVKIKQALKKSPRDILIMAFLVTAIFGYIFYQSLSSPISSNDGTVYANFGRLLLRDRNLANYPTVISDPTTGFYFTGPQHPPGLPLIYTWMYLWQGNSTPDTLARTIAPLYSLLLVILIWLILRRRAGPYAAIFAVLLTVLTPLFVWQTYENSIDPLRLFLFFSAFWLLAKLLEKKNWHLAILAGLSLGFGLFIHASAILILAVWAAIWFLMMFRDIKQGIKLALVVGLVAVIIGGSQYLINARKFHNILGPNTYAISNLDVTDFYKNDQSGFVAHGAAGQTKVGFKLTLPNNLIFGRLQMFSRPEMFGLAYYIFIIALIYWWRHIKHEKLDQIIILAAILVSIPILYKFYLNRRYIFTIHPSVVYLGGLYLGTVYEKWKQKKIIWRFWLIVVGAIMLIGVFFFLPGSIASNKLSQSNQSQGLKLQYLLASKYQQDDLLSSRLLSAIDFLNYHGLADTKVLTYDYGRYFYFSRYPGIHWDNPSLTPFLNAQSQDEAIQKLKDLGLNYIMIEPFYENSSFYTQSYLPKILTDSNSVDLVYNNGIRLYRLK